MLSLFVYCFTYVNITLSQAVAHVHALAEAVASVHECSKNVETCNDHGMGDTIGGRGRRTSKEQVKVALMLLPTQNSNLII